ncbi:twin transmembrane helix small protein [Candidatus Ruthia endofausta]|uniref:Twin transmembrane helix small protein n=1 Tax=Candidatus Ruthia endofausta TaxID=2738852 RepID=A0A6N0HQK2_9GAMM|nr:twin transmembrane helix small protein [Candidatus Ruthia endofausta]QKQ24615.1 twin transmembrane helix small protein [Candidatus Ruthia endofausta]
MTQVIIIVIIVAILIALGSGLLGMLRGGSAGSDKMFKSLVIRVVLSLFLFILVMFAAFMGWIEPNMVMMDVPYLSD